MKWTKSGHQASPDGRVEAIRLARKKQGHNLTLLQEAIIRTIAAFEPKLDNSSHAAFSRIKSSIEVHGQWEDHEEWRISTWFTSKIIRTDLHDRPWFTSTVTCDGQTFSCGCPSIERAYGFMRFYQKLIVDQYYSVGPPWMDQPIFQP